MNITLISPYSSISAYGLRMISARLKRSGHDVQLVFMPKEVPQKRERWLKTFMPADLVAKYDKKTIEALIDLSKNADLIGISLSTNFFESAVQITKELKKKLKAPIIWGGIHPTIRPEECLNYADMVCRGEGEEAMAELAEKMEKGENYLNTQNICFKDKNGKFILNPSRPLIQNLDSLPFQDYDLKAQYIIFGEKTYKAVEYFINDIFRHLFVDREYYFTMFTRGCQFSCGFCCNSFLNKLYCNQKIFRKRSADHMIEELKMVRGTHPLIKNIWFSDDNFSNLSLEEIKEFSEKYKKNIDLPFGLSGVHPTGVAREKTKYLVDAGLIGVSMGIQPGSEKGKKIYKRHYPNSQVEKASKIINEFKNKITIKHYDVIIDSPWESEEDLTKTLMLLSRLPAPYELNVFSLTFFPGTEVYNLAKKEGLIRDELEEIYRKNYWICRRSYLNNLFFLLADFVIRGKRIPPAVMFVLTNKIFRKLRLSLLLYRAMRTTTPQIIKF